MNFQTLLKKKKTGNLFIQIQILPTFLCTLLNIFQAHFPGKYKCMKDKNDWITQGIKISCKNKRKSVCIPKNSNDPYAKAHYIKCRKILRKVINEAKKHHCSRCTAKSNNKIKITWNIMKKDTGKVHSVEDVPPY